MGQDRTGQDGTGRDGRRWVRRGEHTGSNTPVKSSVVCHLVENGVNWLMETAEPECFQPQLEWQVLGGVGEAAGCPVTG